MTATTMLHVDDAFGAVLQDLGRYGRESSGIGRNGAADLFSHRAANRLVGNPDSAATIEVTGNSLVLTPEHDVVLAVTGARARVTLAGEVDVDQWRPLAVPAGTEVRVDEPTSGLRTYIAVRGGIEAPERFGSASPISFWGFANTVSAGQDLTVGSGAGGGCRPIDPVAVERGSGMPQLQAYLDHHLGPAPLISVVRGPQERMFGDMHKLYAETYTMNGNSNEIGSRFDGDTPVRTDSTEILSRSIPIGSVEIPSSGEVIVLLRGRSLTAGYPIPAVVTKADVNRIAQIAPGNGIRFREVSIDDARGELLRQEAVLGEIARSLG